MNSMDRITAIDKSLSVFTSGLFGFIPLVGFVPSIRALIIQARVHKQYRDWNPAAAYLKYGTVFAIIGLLNSGLAMLFIALALANSLIG